MEGATIIVTARIQHGYILEGSLNEKTGGFEMFIVDDMARAFGFKYEVSHTAKKP